MITRKPLSRRIETKVLSLSARRCCLCFTLNNDLTEKLGQLAHLDRDPMGLFEEAAPRLANRATEAERETIPELMKKQQKKWVWTEFRFPIQTRGAKSGAPYKSGGGLRKAKP